MAQVQSMREINKAWKNEGRTFRPQDVLDEYNRQGREALRAREDNILANRDDYPADIVQQIEEHRAAGNYTTQG